MSPPEAVSPTMYAYIGTDAGMPVALTLASITSGIVVNVPAQTAALVPFTEVRPVEDDPTELLLEEPPPQAIKMEPAPTAPTPLRMRRRFSLTFVMRYFLSASVNSTISNDEEIYFSPSKIDCQ